VWTRCKKGATQVGVGGGPRAGQHQLKGDEILGQNKVWTGEHALQKRRDTGRCGGWTPGWTSKQSQHTEKE
jgi:hypothetical protein